MRSHLSEHVSLKITGISLHLRGRDKILSAVLNIIIIIAFIIKRVYITFNFKDSYRGTM